MGRAGNLKRQIMGYSEALEKAGCKILAFEEFGSYQGTWLAFVEYNGQKGIVEGSYGSCSGCDAFQAEFGWGDDVHEENGKYYKSWYADEDNEITKEEYDELKKAADKKLADFGASYLSGGLYDKAHYEQRLSGLDSDDWFDEETKEYCQWAIKQNW